MADAQPKEMTAKEWAHMFTQSALDPSEKTKDARIFLGKLMKEHPKGMTSKDLWNAAVKEEPELGNAYKITDLDAPPSMLQRAKDVAKGAVSGATAATAKAKEAAATPPDSRSGFMYRAFTPISEQVGGPGVSLAGLVHRGTEQAHQSAEEVERMAPPVLRPVIGGIKNFNDLVGGVVEGQAGALDAFTSPASIATMGVGRVAALIPKAEAAVETATSAYKALNQTPIDVATQRLGELTRVFPKLARFVPNAIQKYQPVARMGARGVGVGMAAGAMSQSAEDIRKAIENPSGATIGHALGSTSQAAGAVALPFMGEEMVPRGKAPPTGRIEKIPAAAEGIREGYRPQLEAAPSEFRTSREISNTSRAPIEDVFRLGKMDVGELQGRKTAIQNFLEGKGPIPAGELVDPEGHATRPVETPAATSPKKGKGKGKSPVKEMMDIGAGRKVNLNELRESFRDDLQRKLYAIDMLIEDKQRAMPPPSSRDVREISRPSAPIDAQYEMAEPKGTRVGGPTTEMRRIQSGAMQAPPQTRPVTEVSAVSRTAGPEGQLLGRPPGGRAALPEPQLGRQWVEQQSQMRMTAPEANRLAVKYSLNPNDIVEASSLPNETIIQGLDGLYQKKLQLSQQPELGNARTGADLRDIQGYISVLEEILRIRGSRTPPSARGGQ